MATRIYLPQTGASPITPAFGTWTETTGADRIAGVATRIGSAMTSKTQTHTATAANSTFLSRQYVFGPLAAQTIPASTIKGTIRALESATNDNLDAMRPCLALEWHPTRNALRPDQVARASARVVVWRCEQGHEWTAAVYQRTLSGSGCPHCHRQQVAARTKAGKTRARRTRDEAAMAKVVALHPLHTPDDEAV